MPNQLKSFRPTSKPFQTISPDHKRKLRKPQDGHERRVVDNTARLAQANDQLKHEIKERRHAEELLLKEQRYLRHLLELRDRDQKMFSYEIHDELVQQLVAAIMHLRTFSRLMVQLPLMKEVDAAIDQCDDATLGNG